MVNRLLQASYLSPGFVTEGDRTLMLSKGDRISKQFPKRIKAGAHNKEIINTLNIVYFKKLWNYG